MPFAVRNHKAFEGFKTKPVEFVRNVKMFGTNAMNEVAGGIRALQHQLNHRLVPAMSEVPNTPINTLSTRALMNTADETLSRVVGKGTGEIKNVYNSIKQAPKYPSGFKGVQNGTKKVNVKNQDVLEKLREVESGQWKKIYKDGYDSNGKEISIHYFESQSGKVFDVKVKSGWSNK